MLEMLDAGSYGVAFVVGTLVTAILAWRAAARDGVAPEIRVALLAAVWIAGLAGARLLPLYDRLPHEGEKTVLGALLGGALAVAAVAWWFRTGPRLFNALIPAAPLGMAIGRVGCWLVGCCAGTPTSLPWGTSYVAGTGPFNALVERGLLSANAESTMPLHPVQLYEALADLVIVALVMRLPFRATASRPMAFAAAYALARAALESLRVEHVLATGLAPVQWVLLAVAALLGAWCVARERAACASCAIPRASTVNYRRRLPVSFAVPSVGALLLLPADTITSPAADTLFPRSIIVIGGSGAIGSLVTNQRDCDGNKVTARDHRFWSTAISAAWQRQRNADVGLGVTASVMAGTVSSDREVALDSGWSRRDSAGTWQARGGSLAVNLDGRLVGVTLGASVGRLPVNTTEMVDSMRVQPVVGIRIGRLSKGFAEFQWGDPNTPDQLGAPARLGGAVVVDDRGSLVRVGYAQGGPYASARVVTRAAWEIEPWLQFSGDNKVARLGVRRRIGIGQKVGSKK